jgi:outer membrane immunogenic protein
MKKLLLATASLVVLAGSAMAADLPVYKAAPVVAVPGCAQFGGFYLGGNAGWKYYENKWKDKDNFGFGFAGIDNAGTGDESDNSWTAGIQAGYNFQWHCTVWGVQADWNWTNVSAGNDFTDTPSAGFGRFSYNSEEKWFATLRTRSGVVIDNLLLYVTGGLALARFDRDLLYSVGPGGIFGLPTTFTQGFDSSRTRLGFVVGAGTEWALSTNWSISSEFLYMGFEKDDQTFSCVTTPALASCAPFNADAAGRNPTGTPFRYEFRDTEWVARIGVNYRFGGAAPIVARY